MRLQRIKQYTLLFFPGRIANLPFNFSDSYVVHHWFPDYNFPGWRPVCRQNRYSNQPGEHLTRFFNFNVIAQTLNIFIFPLRTLCGALH